MSDWNAEGISHWNNTTAAPNDDLDNESSCLERCGSASIPKKICILICFLLRLGSMIYVIYAFSGQASTFLYKDEYINTDGCIHKIHGIGTLPNPCPLGKTTADEIVQFLNSQGSNQYIVATGVISFFLLTCIIFIDTHTKLNSTQPIESSRIKSLCSSIDSAIADNIITIIINLFLIQILLLFFRIAVPI